MPEPLVEDYVVDLDGVELYGPAGQVVRSVLDGLVDQLVVITLAGNPLVI